MLNLKPYYLQCMGIETWESRAPKPSRPLQKDQLSAIALKVASCHLCPLHQTRTQTVFSRGNEAAALMIIGEAPGFYEDKQGLPFVGKAGALLNAMLSSIGLNEEHVYIANVLKCRPPDNRDPNSEEINQCGTYLNQQIELIKPKLILALGRFAGQFLANRSSSLHQLRGKIHSHNNVPFMVSYHPAYLLRNPIDKKRAYSDLVQVKKYLSDS